MKFRTFFWILIIGAIAVFASGLLGMGWLASKSSLALLRGGVNRFPAGAVFVPKQAPAMVSVSSNPEKLLALRQVTLPLNKRKSDRLEWQAWEESLAAKIGFSYQRDFKPWLGDEITFAITSLDSDRNSRNGAQPGYILAAETRNNNLAQESLANFYQEQDGIDLESYKGANIIFPRKSSTLWSSAVVGDFVLFANQPQIIKTAINQAQAVNLSLKQSPSYQTVLNNLPHPHIALGYGDILALSAWLDKSAEFKPLAYRGNSGISLSIEGTKLAAHTISMKDKNFTANKTFLDNPELQQIFDSLSFNNRDLAYIDLQNGKSLLEDRIPLYKVTKLAIKSLFPHLKAIAIKKLEPQNNRDDEQKWLDQ